MLCSLLERDKVQRQFKIFRESREREIQDVLQAKRDLELQFQQCLSVWSRDENRSEIMGNMATDWWASSLESDPSIDSLTQVTSFRGPEFFHSPLEKEGPFTNISRGTISLHPLTHVWLKSDKHHISPCSFTPESNIC